MDSITIIMLGILFTILFYIHGKLMYIRGKIDQQKENIKFLEELEKQE